MATPEPLPLPRLDPKKLYWAHDRVVCGAVTCAGMSAAYSGITIGGARVKAMTLIDEYVHAEAGHPLQCEVCHRTMGPAVELRMKGTGKPVHSLPVRLAFRKKGARVALVLRGERASYGDAGQSVVTFKTARGAAAFVAAYPDARMPAWDRCEAVPVEVG